MYWCWGEARVCLLASCGERCWVVGARVSLVRLCQHLLVENSTFQPEYSPLSSPSTDRYARAGEAGDGTERRVRVLEGREGRGDRRRHRPRERLDPEPGCCGRVRHGRAATGVCWCACVCVFFLL